MRWMLPVVAAGTLLFAGDQKDKLGSRTFAPEIPKTWDEAAMASLQVPLATPSASPKHAKAEFYYGLVPRPIYKSYPIYAPGKGPAGYLERLKELEPEVVFDASRLRTAAAWREAGELVFDAAIAYDNGAVNGIVTGARVQDPEWYRETGTPVTRDGIMPFARYVIRKKGSVEVGNLACAMCHTRVLPDGSVLKGAQGSFPFDRAIAFLVKEIPGEGWTLQRVIWRFLFATPWLRPDPLAAIDGMTREQVLGALSAVPPGVLARHGSSIFSPVQVPDLIGVHERRYLDRTGLIRHRAVGDLMRYSALNQGGDDFADFSGFIPSKFLPPPPGSPPPDRYSDDQLYALALYVYSLQPPPNPNKADALMRKGKTVFDREGCAACHTPPLYTNNKLTPVPSFTIPEDHKAKFDILPVVVGTDPTLALKTRRGTGYYKVPSLKGVWYRGPFEHDGSVAMLEDWFDAKRLQDDYVPTGFVGHGVKTRSVRGHEFGLRLPPEDKKALLAFLRTL
jgi:hypothetical protein